MRWQLVDGTLTHSNFLPGNYIYFFTGASQIYLLTDYVAADIIHNLGLSILLHYLILPSLLLLFYFIVIVRYQWIHNIYKFWCLSLRGGANFPKIAWWCNWDRTGSGGGGVEYLFRFSLLPFPLSVFLFSHLPSFFSARFLLKSWTS